MNNNNYKRIETKKNILNETSETKKKELVLF